MTPSPGKLLAIIEQLELVNRHAPRRALHLDAGARIFIQLFAADFHRRIHGRRLLDFPDKAAENGFDFHPRNRPLDRPDGNDVTVGVFGRRRCTERHFPFVRFRRSGKKFRNARRFAKAKRQDAGHVWIERAGMADFLPQAGGAPLPHSRATLFLLVC